MTPQAPWIYETTPANDARFALGQPGRGPLLCIGVNPSTAMPGALDNTVRRIPAYAAAWGFEGWLMLNLSPQRATDSKLLHQELREDWHQANVEAIARHVGACAEPVVLAAWGNLIDSRSYLRRCLHDIHGAIAGKGVRYVALGELTQKAHPRHPLYCRKDAVRGAFDVEGYLGAITRAT